MSLSLVGDNHRRSLGDFRSVDSDVTRQLSAASSVKQRRQQINLATLNSDQLLMARSPSKKTLSTRLLEHIIK
jgi:hypothetical protein